MTAGEWTLGQLLGISGGYWQACVLHTGVRLGIFTLIGSGSRAADDLALRSGCDRQGLTRLLNALVAMGLLERQGDVYVNAPVSRTHLDREAPGYAGHIILHHHHLMDVWSRLPQAVRSGRRIESQGAATEEERRESFLMGMFNVARTLAPALIPHLELQNRRHLLDLGGGPGTYAVQFCRAHPGLRATVYDLPSTRPFAEKTIAEAGMAERIEFQPGDYLKDSIAGRYDVVWLSQVLHGEGPGECRRIIEKAAQALDAGGSLYVHEFLLSDSLDGPLFPALFSLNMLVNTEKGRSYSESQLREMLERAGLKDIRRLPFKSPNDSGLLVGTR